MMIKPEASHAQTFPNVKWRAGEAQLVLQLRFHKKLGNNYIMLNVYELTIITKWVNCAARKMGWKVARGSSSQQQMARDSFWLCCNSCTAIIEGVTLVAQSWGKTLILPLHS